jgi:hypothetical protein
MFIVRRMYTLIHFSMLKSLKIRFETCRTVFHKLIVNQSVHSSDNKHSVVNKYTVSVWISLTQGRGQRRALVKSLISLRVTKRSGVLDYTMNYRFSKKNFGLLSQLRVNVHQASSLCLIHDANHHLIPLDTTSSLNSIHISKNRVK